MTPASFSSNATFSVQVVCESNLAGVYTAESEGTSTDGCCAGTVYMTSVDITISEVSTGVYTLSDWSGNLYLEWYGPTGGNYGITQGYIDGGGLNGEITESCGSITGAFEEPFGSDLVIEGSVDASGVITYTFVNGYGDTGTVTLTRK